jgi:hypothetical protein
LRLYGFAGGQRQRRVPLLDVGTAEDAGTGYEQVGAGAREYFPARVAIELDGGVTALNAGALAAAGEAE